MAEDAEIMADLKRRRGNIKGSCTRLCTNFVNKINIKTTAEAINVRLEMLERYYLEFVEVDDKLSGFSGMKSEIEEFEDSYCTIKEKLRIALGSRDVKNTAIQDQLDTTMGRFADQQQSFFDRLNQSQTATTEVRLPRINIPIFDGSYMEFPSFRDLYLATVHNNGALTNAHKFQYLRSILRGEAETLIKHIHITDANYEDAWEKIIQRYDKPGLVVISLIKYFMEPSIVSSSSSKSLRHLTNVGDEVIRGLSALGPEAEKRDPFLIYLYLEKCDRETRQAWADYPKENFPSFKEFLKFLSKRCDNMETNEFLAKGTNQSKPNKAVAKTFVANNGSQLREAVCVYCEKNHRLFECDEFIGKTLSERRKLAEELHLCYNCLGSGHSVVHCKSWKRCNICRRKHHSMLHTDLVSNQAESKSSESSVPSEAGAFHLFQEGDTEQININNSHVITSNIAVTPVRSILLTARAYVKDCWGGYQECRILLDSGSEMSFISDDCLQRLNLPRAHAKISITGLASKGVTTKGCTNIEMRSMHDSQQKIEVVVLVLNKITNITPPLSLSGDETKNWDSLPLADPHFTQPGEIDILLGNDVFLDILLDGNIKNKQNNLIAQKTLFGWIIGGCSSHTIALPVKNVPAHHTCIDIDNTLRMFWEHEEAEPSTCSSLEEINCEDFFINTYTQGNDKRYQVRLPFKTNPLELGNSFRGSLKRFEKTEERMSKNMALKNKYTNFIREYIDLNHMTLIGEPKTNDGYFLPHHAVFKTTNSEKKIRVVFDGSFKTTTGLSLNNILMVGPTVQPTLWCTLLRFRLHVVALVADIEKMYRQIWIHPDDRKYQKILWRDSLEMPIQEYQLNTITYGTSAAPFLAIRCLIQLCRDHGERYKRASKIIQSDFYVDDLLSGAENEVEAVNLKRELDELMLQGGFKLTKWLSNLPKLSNQNDENNLNLDDGECIKVLGLQWNPSNDMFTFKVNLDNELVPTKRKLLSESSRIFDPLGWLAPSVIIIKLLFQQLWQKKLDWDDTLPEDVLNSWKNIRSKLIEFEKVQIPRNILSMKDRIEIHGFCDASEMAYAAVIYCRILSVNEECKVHLLCSKTKVASLKGISLPKLELCGAHLLTKLLKQILNIAEFNTASVNLWTDSSIVLSWLSESPRKWKTFVQNRVSDILSNSNRSQWNHVKSAENPADVATRGLSPEKLINWEQWWHGPIWMKFDKTKWPAGTLSVDQNVMDDERRPIKVLETQQANTLFDRILFRTNSWLKALRILNYCKKWIYNIQIKISSNKEHSVIEDPGTIDLVDQLNSSETAFVKWAQNKDFAADIKELNAEKCLKRKNQLNSLCPFIDKEGVLRVGGRLENTDCHYNTKHPIILKSTNIISEIIVFYLHNLHHHPGPTLLLQLVRQKYWITGSRNLIRKIFRKCLLCYKQRANTSTQLMGNLPASRVSVSRVFSNVGVDYAGPINILNRKGRGAQTTKGYLAIFICLATKAIHIEVVSDLTSDAFIATLKRFIARRGLPSKIHSDNGGNFVGAHKQLSELNNFISNNNSNSFISDYCAQLGIRWSFIPPRAPHFGGIWEAAVKSVKTHITRVAGCTNLTFEELSTLTSQIEAVLNSRPLCPVNNEDVNNLDVLTPGHFLIMAPLTALPEDMQDQSFSCRSRWKVIQQLVKSFWKKYSTEYLNTLQQRYKWQHQDRNLQVNDLVLIKEDNLSPCHWVRGRILEVHPGSDGVVRVATVKTSTNCVKRPIVKLSPLPLND